VNAAAFLTDETRSAMPRSSIATHLALTALGLCVLLSWMLQHPFAGLIHDSRLYSLQALARLHPSLSNDIFLKFGSQDSYTLFSPLFAAAIRLLDLEPAAALGTLLGHAVFFWGAWLLARRLMPGSYALLALGLLACLPSWYGAQTIFRYVEDFLTPRAMAEGLTLMALAAWLDERQVSGGLCLLAGMLLHPIMAFAGIVMAALLYGVIPRPRLGVLIIAAGSIATLLLVATLSSGPLTRFDPQWLHIIDETSPFLFIRRWDMSDWMRAVPPAAALLVGVLTTTKPLIRNLCTAALAMAACGLLAAIVFCDLLHVQLLTQMQPWRWLWLEQAVAIILLPVIVRECWQSGLVARAASLILASSWIFPVGPLVLGVAFAAVGCAALTHRGIEPRLTRPIFAGSCALVALAVLNNFAAKLGQPPIMASSPSAYAASWLGAWTKDGTLYAALLVTALWIVERRPSMPWSTASVIALAALDAFFAPLTWHRWSVSQYKNLYTAAAPWRAAIPANAQIIWPTTPVGAWYALERASYWSHSQDAGDIFSRRKSVEAYRRGMSILTALTPRSSKESDGPRLVTVDLDQLGSAAMPRVCADPNLDYVVSWSHLGPTSFPPITVDPNKPNGKLYLYGCTDFR
jgi:hypothetical protein